MGSSDSASSGVGIGSGSAAASAAMVCAALPFDAVEPQPKLNRTIKLNKGRGNFFMVLNGLVDEINHD